MDEAQLARLSKIGIIIGFLLLFCILFFFPVREETFLVPNFVYQKGKIVDIREPESLASRALGMKEYVMVKEVKYSCFGFMIPEASLDKTLIYSTINGSDCFIYDWSVK